jgi:predicted Zn-dependent protease
VPSSLILAVKDEDELAGMLAHAIAHVASRNGTRLASKTELVNMASVPLIYMGGWTGQSLAIPLGMLHIWRRYELDADRLAARKMAAAGYDPAALARYIERVQAPDAVQLKMWSSLPPRSQRVEAIRAVTRDLPAQVYGPHESLEKVQDEVRRMTAGTPKAPPTLSK